MSILVKNSTTGAEVKVFNVKLEDGVIRAEKQCPDPKNRFYARYFMLSSDDMKEYDGTQVRTFKLSPEWSVVTKSRGKKSAPETGENVAGVPNSMIRTENVPQKNRTIDILYSMNASSRIPTEEIINAGVNLLSAILMLRNDNVTVNLYMLDTSCVKKYDLVGAAIKIKDASQEIDVLNCAYAMCHPSFLRRHMFRWLEVTYPKYVSGYGIPLGRDMTEEFMRENNVSGTLVLFSEICGLTKEEIIKKYFDKK